MKLAITAGPLQIPPTYFVITHAQSLRQLTINAGTTLNGPEMETTRSVQEQLAAWGKTVESTAFCLLGNISDPEISVPIKQAVPNQIAGRTLTWRQKELAIPLFLPRWIRQLDNFQPDLIHQHFGTWSLAATRVAKKRNVPLVVTIHGYDAFMHNVKPARLKLKPQQQVFTAWRQADKLLPVSKYLYQVAKENGAPAEKMTVHYQGIDTDFFTPLYCGDAPHAVGALKSGTQNSIGEAVTELEGEIPKIVCVGSWVKHKGVLDVAAASAKICSTYPHKLVFIGAGPLKPQLQEYAAKYTHIELHSNLTKKEVRAQLQTAWLHVLASKPLINRLEAAGLVTLEAGSCACPALVYDSGGTSEMVNPELAKQLVITDPSIDKLCVYLSNALSWSRSERLEIGQNCRTWIKENRSLQASLLELKDIYSEVIG